MHVLRQLPVEPLRPRLLRPDTWPLPTPRALLALGLAAALLALNTWVAIAAALALLAAFVVDARSVRAEPVLELDVRAPQRLGLGQQAELELELHNPCARRRPLQMALDAGGELLPAASRSGALGPAAGELGEASEPDVDPLTARHFELAPRASHAWSTPLAARRRGRHTLRALDLRLTASAGLAAVPARAPLELEVEVVPGWVETRAQRLRASFARQRGGQHLQRRRGAGHVFESLAEYTVGDDPRHLDWKATARRRTPIVRRYEIERRQNVVIVCDTGRWMAERIDGDDPVFPRERLDAALSAACALGHVAHDWGDHLGLMLFGERVSVLELPGPRVWTGLPSRLAGVRASVTESDYARALAELTRRVRRRSLVVLISDVLDSEVSEPLARAFAALAKRHLPLFVALGDPRLESAARIPVEDPLGLHRRTAALELRHARARTLESMRASGIDVLDVQQASATTALVDRYLALRQAGRL